MIIQTLNNATIKDSFPIPKADDLSDQLAGHAWFSTIDLKSGYWQIRINPKDREQTAFSIGKGLWQFKVKTFRLCNGPATFQRLMEDVLRELNQICTVFLDDVISYSKFFQEMIAHLGLIFQKSRKAGLKVNSKKCLFIFFFKKSQILSSDHFRIWKRNKSRKIKGRIRLANSQEQKTIA